MCPPDCSKLTTRAKHSNCRGKIRYANLRFKFQPHKNLFKHFLPEIQ